MITRRWSRRFIFSGRHLTTNFNKFPTSLPALMGTKITLLMNSVREKLLSREMIMMRIRQISFAHIKETFSHCDDWQTKASTAQIKFHFFFHRLLELVNQSMYPPINFFHRFSLSLALTFTYPCKSMHPLIHSFNAVLVFVKRSFLHGIATTSFSQVYSAATFAKDVWIVHPDFHFHFFG